MTVCGINLLTLLRLRCGGCLAAVLVTSALHAGEPIHFSSPDKEMAMPAKKDPNIKLPGPTLKWPDHNLGEDWTPPPPIMPIDPRLEKRLRERREEQRNWLINEPDIFKDKFQDPFQETKSSREGTLPTLDSSVEGLLSRGSEAKQDRKTVRPMGVPAFSDERFFDHDTLSRKSDDSGLQGREHKERSSARNSTGWDLRELFDQKAASDRMPLQPGMSLYEMWDATKVRTEKREEDARRKGFTRLLEGVSPPLTPSSSRLVDPINTQEDLTRAPLNPVTPVVGGGLQALPNARDTFGMVNAIQRPARPLPFEDLSVRSPAAAAAAAQRQQDKNRQLESLKLMTRPAVLEFPGRHF